MPKPRAQERWDSKNYAVGFAYNRNGIAYINIAGKVRKSTGVKFLPKNKKLVLDMVDSTG